MTSLAELQRVFGKAFREMIPLAERDDMAEPIRTVVSGNDRLTPHEQADIYREQFWLRHRDVLREDYPALRYWLEEDGFNAFCRAYLLAYPPNSYTLRDLGYATAKFAQEYDGFAPERAAVARDLARFELAFIDIFDAHDVAPLDAEALSALSPQDWERARLDIHPMLTVLKLDHPVQDIRRAVRAEEEPPREMAPDPTWLAMWRAPDLKVNYRRIDETEHHLLETLRDGQALAPACEAIAADLDEAAQEQLGARIGKWFQGWALRGWVVGIHLDAA